MSLNASLDALLTRGAAALLAAGVLAGCAEKAVVEPVTPSGGAMFESYVAIGGSITAGLQAGGINENTQRQSYAYLLAQRMGTRFAIPALALPGCTPPATSFTELGSAARLTTCALRTPASATAVLNNVAVPDAYAIDPTTASTASSNTLTNIILGGKTQVQKALEADPTFVSVWVGNNDALAAAVRGILAALPGVSPGLTQVADFQTRYDAITTQLTTARPELEGVLIGVVDVRGAPILFPVAALLTSPQFKGGFDQYTGGTTTVLPNCAAAPTTLISMAIVGAIRTYRANPAAAGAHPPVISCASGAVPGAPLVGDVFVLDPAEQAAVGATVAAYNAHIQATATELGWAYYDPNPLLLQLRQSGAIPLVPNLADPTALFGPNVTVDGVHPSALTHRVLAAEIAAAIAAAYPGSLPMPVD